MTLAAEATVLLLKPILMWNTDLVCGICCFAQRRDGSSWQLSVPDKGERGFVSLIIKQETFVRCTFVCILYENMDDRQPYFLNHGISFVAHA